MKRFNFLLLGAIFSLCAFTLQAQFVPEEGKHYRIKHAETGLYLDTDPNEAKQAILTDKDEASLSQQFVFIEEDTSIGDSELAFPNAHRIKQVSSGNYFRKSGDDRPEVSRAWIEAYDKWADNFAIAIEQTENEGEYYMGAIYNLSGESVTTSLNRYFCKNPENNMVKSLVYNETPDHWIIEEVVVSGFAPEEGKQYFIKNVTHNLYLDGPIGTGSDSNQAFLTEKKENSLTQRFTFIPDAHDLDGVRFDGAYNIIQVQDGKYFRKSSGRRGDITVKTTWPDNYAISFTEAENGSGYYMKAIYNAGEKGNNNSNLLGDSDKSFYKANDSERVAYGTSEADVWVIEEAPEVSFIGLVTEALEEAITLKEKIEGLVPENEDDEQQLGQYSYEEYINLLTAIEDAEAFVNANEENPIGEEIINKLKVAMEAIPDTYKCELNTFPDGIYFITANDKYFTIPESIPTNTNAPLSLNEVRDISSLSQAFTIKKWGDGLDRYQILSTEKGWNVTEQAVLRDTWGDSDHTWRTMNFYYNGSNYAIQSAGGGAAYGFWSTNEENTQPSFTRRTILEPTEDFIFNFISLQDAFAEEVANGETLLNEVVIGFEKGQYLQSVYNEFKAAWEKANTLLEEEAEITTDILIEYGLAVAAFLPNEEDIVKYYTIKNITNGLYLDSEGTQAILSEREESSFSQIFVLENEPTIDEEGDGEALYPGAVRIKQLSSGNYFRKQGNTTENQAYAYITEIDQKWPDNFAIFFESTDTEGEIRLYASGDDENRYFTKDANNNNVRSYSFGNDPDIWILEEVGETIDNPAALTEALESAKEYYNSISPSDVLNNDFSKDLGKYGRTAYDNLNELIQDIEEYLSEEGRIYYINDVIEHTTALNAAVSELRNSYRTEVNKLDDGDYYITINDKYFTIPANVLGQNTDTPLILNEQQDANTLSQIFTITKWEEVERYQILSTEKGWNITEKAVLRDTWGDSDHDWRTMNFYSNGSKYAIQSAGSSSKYGFWGYDSENNEPTTTSRTEMDINTDFIFDFTPVSTVLARKVTEGENLLTTNEENIGDAKGQYSQDVYDIFKAAVEKASELAENGTATGEDLMDYNEAVKKFVPNTEDGIDDITENGLIITAENNAIKVITNDNQAISVYTVSGILIHQSTVNGEAVIAVPTGIYIVKAEAKTVKIAVN